MGAVGGLLGLGGGAGGTGFGVNPGVTNQQIGNAYTGVQGSLGNQQSLLNALQGQKGLQNQTSVYNQLQNVANGQGPNPAQAMLAQATGQNVANQGALAAGQRGAAQNVGLLSRQAAQQGANLQQQAAGQGATMQANQSLQALGNLGNLATTMAGQQIGQTNANTQAQQAEQQNLLNANSQNNAIQGQLANTQLQGGQNAVGGIGNAIGAITGLFADGGQVDGIAPSPPAFGPQSMFGQFLSGQSTPMPTITSNDPAAQELNKSLSSIGNKIAAKQQQNPNSSANMQRGMNQFNQMTENPVPQQAPASMDGVAAAHGGNVGDKLKSGGHVPGQAQMKGDSLKNDTVKAMLSPGEIVIPRSVVQSKDPIRGSAEFVRAVLAKKKVRG